MQSAWQKRAAGRIVGEICMHECDLFNDGTYLMQVSQIFLPMFAMHSKFRFARNGQESSNIHTEGLEILIQDFSIV